MLGSNKWRCERRNNVIMCPRVTSKVSLPFMRLCMMSLPLAPVAFICSISSCVSCCAVCVSTRWRLSESWSVAASVQGNTGKGQRVVDSQSRTCLRSCRSLDAARRQHSRVHNIDCLHARDSRSTPASPPPWWYGSSSPSTTLSAFLSTSKTEPNGAPMRGSRDTVERPMRCCLPLTMSTKKLLSLLSCRMTVWPACAQDNRGPPSAVIIAAELADRSALALMVCVWLCGGRDRGAHCTHNFHTSCCSESSASGMATQMLPQFNCHLQRNKALQRLVRLER